MGRNYRINIGMSVIQRQARAKVAVPLGRPGQRLGHVVGYAHERVKAPWIVSSVNDAVRYCCIRG
jgi:hypothetical protein